MYLINIGLEKDAYILHQAVQLLSQMLMELEVEQQVWAGKHERTLERKNYRKGLRYLDMHDLEDALEYINAASSIDVRVHDAVLA